MSTEKIVTCAARLNPSGTDGANDTELVNTLVAAGTIASAPSTPANAVDSVDKDAERNAAVNNALARAVDLLQFFADMNAAQRVQAMAVARYLENPWDEPLEVIAEQLEINLADLEAFHRVVGELVFLEEHADVHS